MTEILQKLYDLQDKEYAIFQAKLTPGVERERFIGVRVPILRKLAKEIYKEGNYEEFINDLPHKFYDENMLHGLILSEYKDYEACIKAVDKFLPYVDNWAVCDTMSPKIFKKHKVDLIGQIKRWSASKDTFTCRFGLEMLMSFYLDDDFIPEYLDIPTAVKSDEYYVNMMIAWFLATALAKQWELTITVIESKTLDAWVQNKTIQKARESYRITPQQKEYLKTLKK